jgi:hypothetical protein
MILLEVGLCQKEEGTRYQNLALSKTYFMIMVILSQVEIRNLSGKVKKSQPKRNETKEES